VSAGCLFLLVPPSLITCPSPPSPLDLDTYIPSWVIYVYFTSWAFFLVFLFGVVLCRSERNFFFCLGRNCRVFSSFFLLHPLSSFPCLHALTPACFPSLPPPCPPSHRLPPLPHAPALPSPQGPSQDGAAQSPLQTTATMTTKPGRRT